MVRVYPCFASLYFSAQHVERPLAAPVLERGLWGGVRVGGRSRTEPAPLAPPLCSRLPRPPAPWAPARAPNRALAAEPPLRPDEWSRFLPGRDPAASGAPATPGEVSEPGPGWGWTGGYVRAGVTAPPSMGTAVGVWCPAGERQEGQQR